MIQNKFSNHMSFHLIIKILLVVLFLSSVSAPPLWAQSYEEQYGEELQAVPYAIRVRYAKEAGQPWSEASYDERLAYLDALYREEMATKMHEEQVINDKQMIEMQKLTAREYSKNAEIQKNNSREMAKEYKRMAEEQKKYQLQLRSIQQKQKIQQMRDQQR
jgi:hypothetical protein